MSVNNTFDIEENDGTVVLTPLKELGELHTEGMEQDFETVVRRFANREVARIVIDLQHVDYFGSTVLGFLVKLWQQVHSLGGEMAFCNVSPHAQAILKAAHVERLWPLCNSRDEALATVSGR